VERSGDDDGAVGGRIVASLVLTGGNHPGERGGEDEAKKEEGECIREPSEHARLYVTGTAAFGGAAD
jgi:hypothetical protein